MKPSNLLKRASGVLAHISSLPSPFGIGDIGPPSLMFLDYLEAAGQKYWQILPTGPTSLVFGSSPYMSSSACAGSPLLISPQALYESGLIPRAALDPVKNFSPYYTHYSAVTDYKTSLLGQAYQEFSSQPDKTFAAFTVSAGWLEDYALFMALKEFHHGIPWHDWPEPLARRVSDALDQAREVHAARIQYYLFEQYIFSSQWVMMKNHAKEKGIQLIGDVPIYLGLDSADVWANQELFELDSKSLKPLRVSGVPPDYFSKTGQRWGNPLYRWKSADAGVREKLVCWWAKRLNAVFELVDITRIDHFRGFESFWAIPAREETAVNGKWLKGPGFSFFTSLHEKLGHLNIIAEDLGDISPAVTRLRERLNFPGMKVLQFAFDGNPENPFLPYNYTDDNCVVYTGTHDNDTSIGWFLSDHIDDKMRTFIKKFVNRDIHDDSPIHQDMIYLALSSPARLAILPLQDVLGFGSDCRMNTPSIPDGNWQWRCAEEFLTDGLASWLKEITMRFGR